MTHDDTDSVCQHEAMLPNRIMVVAPHPDDEVIGCGGLLARAAREGSQTHVVVVACEDAQREVELAHATNTLGVFSTAVLFAGAAFIDHVADHEIVGGIDAELAAFRPELVLIPSMAGYHQEHRRVASLAVSAMRPGGGRSSGHAPAQVWYYEAPADVSSPTGAWSPTITIELSDADLDDKIAAMECHASQVRPAPSERSLDALRSLAVLRGSQVGVHLGEAYAPRRMVL